MILPRIIAASLAACACLHLTAVAAEPSPARKEALRDLVLQDCGSCHGTRLKGGLGPALLPDRIGAIPDRYLVDVILQGREGTAMPPWSPFLVPEEARWIVQQLKQGGFRP